MLTMDEGRDIAKKYLPKLSDNLELYNNPIHQGSYGWVFGYQSRKFIETGNFSDQLAGNSPLLVDKQTQKLYVLGTAQSVDFYVKNYIAFGDPFKVPGKIVELLSWNVGGKKVAANREIRKYSDIGLKDAKLAIDRCLDGKKHLIECRSAEDAEQLVNNLYKLGFIAQQLGE